MPKFVGNVVTKWLQEPTGEAREMKRVEDFAFQDPQGRIWKAPKGRKIDGASIPPVVWTLVGSPFTGNYRRASVIHDIACQDKPLTSAEAHRMFYDAMKADNTDEWTARVFYAAVSNFGPQWGDRGQNCGRSESCSFCLPRIDQTTEFHVYATGRYQKFETRSVDLVFKDFDAKPPPWPASLPHRHDPPPRH